MRGLELRLVLVGVGMTAQMLPSAKAGAVVSTGETVGPARAARNQAPPADPTVWSEAQQTLASTRKGRTLPARVRCLRQSAESLHEPIVGVLPLHEQADALAESQAPGVVPRDDGAHGPRPLGKVVDQSLHQ